MRDLRDRLPVTLRPAPSAGCSRPARPLRTLGAVAALLLAAPATAQAPDGWIDLGLTLPAVIAERDTRAGLLAVPPLRPFYDDHDQEDLAYTDAAVLAAGVLLPGTDTRPDVEVALSGRVPFDESLVPVDDGSYLRLRWRTALGKVVVTGYPVGADAVRIGYANRLSVNAAEIVGAPDAVLQPTIAPALRAGLAAGWGYAWAAVAADPVWETVSQGGNEVTRQATAWSALAGFGAEAQGHLRLEGSGGWFRQGTNPTPGVRGEEVVSFAAAARVTWAEGLPWETPVDYRPLVDDPFTTDRLFPGRRATRDGWSVSASGLVGGQHLADPDDLGERTWQLAWGADLQAVVSRDDWHVDGFFRARTPQLILFAVPGFVPYQALQEGAAADPELAGALQVARRLGARGLTPRVSFGLCRPASVSSAPVTSPSPGGRRVVVLPGPGDYVVLPNDASTRLRVDGRVGLDVRLTDSAALSAEAVLIHDANRVRVERGDMGTTVSVFDDPFSWGVNLLARARF